MTTTHVNMVHNPIISDHTDKDDLLTFTGAGTVPAWTILARSTATDKMVPFVSGGVADGNGVPAAVLMHDCTATGAGDESCTIFTGGRLLKSLVQILADGDASNIDAAVVQQLQTYNITLVESRELSERDNV